MTSGEAVSFIIIAICIVYWINKIIKQVKERRMESFRINNQVLKSFSPRSRKTQSCNEGKVDFRQEKILQYKEKKLSPKPNIMKPLKNLVIPSATTFLALDVETANQYRRSICQVGLAAFSDTELLDSWCSYIDPEEDFAHRNIAIHGIQPSMVSGSPTFTEIYPELCKLENYIMVQHSTFDSSAITKASEKHSLTNPNIIWVDSIKIAKKTWPNFESYKLNELSNRFGIKLQHHDAEEDAIAAGKVTLEAIVKSRTSIQEWAKKLN